MFLQKSVNYLQYHNFWGIARLFVHGEILSPWTIVYSGFWRRRLSAFKFQFSFFLPTRPAHSYILTPEHNGPSADEVAHPDLTAIKEKNDYAQGILLILSAINFAGDFDIGPGCLAALHH